ncbi:MAG TPA: hypothetical protein VF054_06465 [Micromonosporaceae bacterium]
MSDSVHNFPDVATLAADDLLLDALARGESAVGDDPIAALLAAWRADLDEDVPADLGGAALADADCAAGAAAGAAPVRPDGGADPDAAPVGGDLAPVVPIRAPRRRLRLVAAAAAVVLAGGAAVTTAASHAGPDSPLWGLTRVLYQQQAHAAAAEDAISDARQAAQEGRYDDATRLLDQASAEISRIRDAATAERLRAEVEAVRAMLPAPVPPSAAPSPVPSSTPRPTPTPPGAGSTPAPAPTPGAPSSSPNSGLLPGLPLPPLTGSGGILPSLPLPLPGISLF